MDGLVDLHRVGTVRAATGTLPPFVVVDGAGVEVEPVTRYLRDLALSDMSPLRNWSQTWKSGGNAPRPKVGWVRSRVWT
jgi:hypothetical protein